MTPIVASLSLIGRNLGEDDFPLTVEIGAPYQVGKEEWACPVSVSPLYDHLPDMRGGDLFQAIFLAMRLALTLLKDFNDKRGAVLFPEKGSHIQGGPPISL